MIEKVKLPNEKIMEFAKESSGVANSFIPCSKGRLIPNATDLAPTFLAPLFAASIIPGPRRSKCSVVRHLKLFPKTIEIIFPTTLLRLRNSSIALVFVLYLAIAFFDLR